MITLKALRVEALKTLHGVDLRFPPRGGVLIEGANESGKSSLFEAVYFALYGRALVGEERPTLAGLIPHGRARAAVALTVALDGGRELTVERVLTRGRHGSVNSEAALTIQRPGAAMERVNAVNAVNDRIEQELRGIDSDTFRNSLFMEQKGLERIEEMSRDGRDKAVSRLLGLERLAEAERTVAPSPALLTRRETLRKQLGVAERLDLARAAGARGAEADTRLRAAEISAAITRRDALADERLTLARHEARLTDERDDLRSRLERYDRVAALERDLVAASALRWSAINAEREAEGLTARLGDMAASEQLPEARRRLAEISALEERMALAQSHQLQASGFAAAALRIAGSAESLDMARQEIIQAGANLTAARAAAAVGRQGEALAGWVRAREATTLLSDNDHNVLMLRADRDREQIIVDSAAMTERAWLAVTTVAGAISLALATLAMTTHAGALWIFAGMFAAVTLALSVLWRKAVTQRRALAWRVAHLDGEINGLTMQVNLGRRLDGAGLEHYEAGLRAAGLAIPTSLEEARAHLAALPQPDAGTTERVREGEAALARARFIEERAAQELDQARDEWRSDAATAALAPDQAGDRYDEAQRDLAQIMDRARSLGLPDDLTGLAAARGAAFETVRTLEAASGDYSRATARLDDQRLHVVSARDEWRAALAEVTDGARAAGLDAPEGLGGDTSEVSLERLEGWHAALAATLATGAGASGDGDSANVDTLRARSGANAAELDQSTAARERLESDRARQADTISAWLAGVGVEATGDEELAVLAGRWPPLADAPTLDADGLEALRAERAQADREVYHHTQASQEGAEGGSELAAPGALDGAAGDLRAALAGVEREIRQRDLAARLAAETRARITRRALPETEAYMRAILPALTLGRYRDVSLTRDEGESAPGVVDLVIRMWDDVAGRYVRKGLFSGGARDQASLALRLAFALATLPRGRGATPGFIFLDEPLSSFDAERSRALARALTHGPIAQAFPQVFLISHSQVIDPRDFDYTLRMEDGRAAASTLPSADSAAALWAAEAENTPDAPSATPTARTVQLAEARD